MAKYLFLSFILFNSCFSKEFIVTYRLFTKNNALIHEEYYVTLPMILTPRKKNFECLISFTKEFFASEQDFLNSHKNEILECMMQGNILVKSVEENQKRIFSENISYITLPSTHLDVNLNSNSAKIIVFRD